MKNRITGTAILILAAAWAPLAARAAGPGSYVTKAGVPAKWKSGTTIIYNLDQGPLSSTVSNSKAAKIVTAAFAAVAGIDTASLKFEEGDPLDRDVTAANYSDFIAGLPSDVSPVIFDQNGAITQGLTGSRSILAFGVPRQVTPTGTIPQGMIVINGRAMDGLFDPDDVTEADLTRAVVRAILQMLNVGPSDLNAELVFDGNVANNTAVPIMSPFVVIGGGSALTRDDRMAVSALYPSADIDKKTGTITGHVVLPDGKTGIQGISVIARPSDDPINGAVSAITGALFLNQTLRPQLHGSPDPNLTGEFEMRVPPGSYTLEIRTLRSAIGPRASAIPTLPNGPQFYQATASPTTGPEDGSTAAPADASSATPVQVDAGKTADVTIPIKGTAAPASQAITDATTPHLTPDTAQPIALNSVVTGTVSAGDPGLIYVDAGGGARDKIERLYRLNIPVQSLVTMSLAAKDNVDLDLYTFSGIPYGAASYLTVPYSSFTDGPETEFVQYVAGPGTYFIGVDAWDGPAGENVKNPAPTAFTLTVTATPWPDAAPLPTPVLNQLVIRNIGTDSAEAQWITDIDATADALIGIPVQQVGDPTVGKTHKVALAGLATGAYSDLTAFSQAPGGALDNLPRAFFRTANKTPASGPAKLNAAVIGAVADTIGTRDNTQDTIVIAVGIQNTGGDATGVQLTTVTASTGWKLATPVTAPIDFGKIGSGGVAVAEIRLIRDGKGPAPLATVTGTGTYTAGGAAQTFTIGG